MKLKNITPDVLSLYRPEGQAGALVVEPGQVAEVPGELAGDQPCPDAILIDHNGELRAYATWAWELAGKPGTTGGKPGTDSKSEG